MVQAVVVGPLLRRKPGFKRWPVHVGFVVHKVALTLFSRVLQLSPVSMIPPLLPIHSSLTDCTLSQQVTAFLNKTTAIILCKQNRRFQARQIPNHLNTVYTLSYVLINCLRLNQQLTHLFPSIACLQPVDVPRIGQLNVGPHGDGV